MEGMYATIHRHVFCLHVVLAPPLHRVSFRSRMSLAMSRLLRCGLGASFLPPGYSGVVLGVSLNGVDFCIVLQGALTTGLRPGGLCRLHLDDAATPGHTSLARAAAV